MSKYGFGVSEFLECVQHAVENGTIKKIDLDMPKGEMTVAFVIPQRLVSKFNKSCEKVMHND